MEFVMVGSEALWRVCNMTTSLDPGSREIRDPRSLVLEPQRLDRHLKFSNGSRAAQCGHFVLPSLTGDVILERMDF